ncbi:zinc finger protein 3-like [Portunus trituberculatus]|uniref:zinc finger protein 3-like n=1 Tax=Portunus trituberculatus TaxID=210409 RepID=UPI001E1CCA61|nr:zinc finger protein 3-like [Portunus trituberculatus]
MLEGEKCPGSMFHAWESVGKYGLESYLGIAETGVVNDTDEDYRVELGKFSHNLQAPQAGAQGICKKAQAFDIIHSHAWSPTDSFDQSAYEPSLNVGSDFWESYEMVSTSFTHSSFLGVTVNSWVPDCFDDPDIEEADKFSPSPEAVSDSRIHTIDVSAEVTHHTWVSTGYTLHVCQQMLHTIRVSAEVTHHACVSRGYTPYVCQQRLRTIHVSAEVTHHTCVSRCYTSYACQQRLHTICASADVTHHMCVSRGYTPYMWQQRLHTKYVSTETTHHTHHAFIARLLMNGSSQVNLPESQVNLLVVRCVFDSSDVYHVSGV